MAGGNFGGFGGFVKNSSKSAKLTSRQNYNFSPFAKLNSHHNYYFSPFAKLFFRFLQLSFNYFEHRAISNKSLKNMKRLRVKNSSLFISLLKLVNFNNTFALLLYFFLCQDTSGKMFLSIRQNKLPLKFYFCMIRQIKFPPKFNFFVIRQIKFRQITSLLRSAKITSLKV